MQAPVRLPTWGACGAAGVDVYAAMDADDTGADLDVDVVAGWRLLRVWAEA